MSEASEEGGGMVMQSVSSSNVAAVGHDPESGTLRVEFHSGAVYEYAEVPDNKAAELIGASSVGRYLATNIKGQYPARKVG
jgi:hypothetical protein